MQPVDTLPDRAEIHRTHLQQMRRIVQAAVLVEIRADRRQLDILMVVADHFQHMLSLAFEPDGERRIAALVRRDGLPVQPDLGSLGGAFQQQEGALPGKTDFAFIIRRPTVIGGGMPVFRIVGMRHGNFGPGRAVLAERPAVKLLDLGGIILGGNGKGQRCGAAQDQDFLHWGRYISV